MFPHTNEITVEFMKGYPTPRGLPALATLAEKDLLLQTEAKTQNRNNLKEINMQDSYLHVFILSNNVVWRGSELDVFSKNKLLPTVIKNTIIFQTSYFETVFVISTMFTHVTVKSSSFP